MLPEKTPTKSVFSPQLPSVDALSDVFADAIVSVINSRPRLNNVMLTCCLFPRRVLVVERTDGLRCWLSVGKKQKFNPGPSGWVNVSWSSSVRTLCAEAPLVFRPVSGASVTCLVCLAQGVPPHLQSVRG